MNCRFDIKSYIPAVIGLVGVITGAVISTVPDAVIQQVQYANDRKVNEYIAARESIAAIFDIHNANLQVYLYSAETLKGEELYGIKHTETWLDIGCFPNDYDTKIETNLNNIRSYILKHKGKNQHKELLALIDRISFLSQTLYDDFFFDTDNSRSVIWKKERIPNKVIADVFAQTVFNALTALSNCLEEP